MICIADAIPDVYPCIQHCVLFIHLCVTSCEVNGEHCWAICDLIMIGGYVEVFTHDVMLHYGYVLVQYTTRNCTTTFCHMDHDCNMIMHD